MKYVKVLIILPLLLTIKTMAEPVRLEEAVEIAKLRRVEDIEWLRHQVIAKSDDIIDTIIIKHKDVNAYLFYFKTGGFIMISGDDNSDPYMCGSVEGKYDYDFMHERGMNTLYKDVHEKRKLKDSRLKGYWDEIRYKLNSKNKLEKKASNR